MAVSPTAPDMACEDRRITFRPPPFLGAIVVAAPRCCSAVVITVGPVGPVDAPGTVVIFVDVRDGAAAVERRRQVVAIYRWLLSQQVDPPTVALVVPDDDMVPLTAFFAHCGDPAPGAITSPGVARWEEPAT